jgi:hypothetical protein
VIDSLQSRDREGSIDTSRGSVITSPHFPTPPLSEPASADSIPLHLSDRHVFIYRKHHPVEISLSDSEDRVPLDSNCSPSQESIKIGLVSRPAAIPSNKPPSPIPLFRMAGFISLTQIPLPELHQSRGNRQLCQILDPNTGLARSLCLSLPIH